MAGMGDQRYLQYLDSIESFLKNDKSRQFSIDHFSETLVREILNGLSHRQ